MTMTLKTKIQEVGMGQARKRGRTVIIERSNPIRMKSIVEQVHLVTGVQPALIHAVLTSFAG